MVKDQTVRADHDRNNVLSKLNYDKDYQDRLTTRKKENEVLHKNTLGYKSDMHAKQREHENNLKVATAKRNPFNAKINQQSLQNATKRREQKNNMTGYEMEEAYAAEQAYDEMDAMSDAMDLLNDGPEGGMDDISQKLTQEVA